MCLLSDTYFRHLVESGESFRRELIVSRTHVRAVPEAADLSPLSNGAMGAGWLAKNRLAILPLSLQRPYESFNLNSPRQTSKNLKRE